MLNRRSIRVALVCTAFLIALGMRCGFNYGLVFRSGGVHFQEADGYFHMRTVRNLMHHFPRRSGFDPYSGIPEGQPVTTGPFYDLAIGTTAWLIGFGSPSTDLIGISGAWFPAVMGALITVPVYLIGSALFRPLAGLFAAFLIAILPGGFMRVSRLGFTDHHVAESFLATLALLFLVLALQDKRRVLNTILAGVALGCFLVNRPVGAFLIGFIALWAVLQSVLDHWTGKPNRVWLVVAPAILLAWLIFLPVGPIIWSEFTLLALGTGFAAVVLTGALAAVVRPRFVFLGILAAAGVAGFAGVMIWKPALLPSLWQNIALREGDGPASTVSEMRPLLTMYGSLSWRPAWDEFTTTWIFALPALALLTWRSWSASSPALNLFLAWSAFMLALSLAQNRNCYFLAVNMALLAGWACWEMLRLGKVYERLMITGLLLAALVYPNVAGAIEVLKVDASPNKDWDLTLRWLRDNTPEPFAGASAYDRYYPALPPNVAFHYPPEAYGIMTWWDYGHWISAQSRRIPVSNGMQTGATTAARFFTTSNAEEAGQLMRQARARYVLADSAMIMPSAKDLDRGSGKILAMQIWLGGAPQDLADVYLSEKPEGGTEPVVVFYPKYYESMLARLYLSDGAAVVPDSSTWIIGYKEGPLEGKRRQRTITSATSFKTYEEASAYIEKVNGEPFVLAGLDPLKSCLPLKRLEDFRLVYSTQPGALSNIKATIHAIKVFEYQP